jgi:hypothetical protein
MMVVMMTGLLQQHAARPLVCMYEQMWYINGV